MKVRVKVDEAGYFDLRFRKEGEVFDIPSEKQFSKRWMEKVEPPAPPVAVEPPAHPADPVPPVQPKVETPVEPKPEVKPGAEPKPATGDRKVL